MKCLIRMSADAQRGVIFYETVISFKSQKHTYIECVPVPLNVFDELPAYFRVSYVFSFNLPFSKTSKPNVLHTIGIDPRFRSRMVPA